MKERAWAAIQQPGKTKTKERERGNNAKALQKTKSTACVCVKVRSDYSTAQSCPEVHRALNIYIKV